MFCEGNGHKLRRLTFIVTLLLLITPLQVISLHIEVEILRNFSAFVKLFVSLQKSRNFEKRSSSI